GDRRPGEGGARPDGGDGPHPRARLRAAPRHAGREPAGRRRRRARRRPMKRRATAAAALAAVVLLLEVFVPGPDRLDAADSKTGRRVAIPWTPETLAPTMNLSSIRATVGVSLFDSLVGRDRDNRIVPELAESWKLVNETTWQLRLRRGVVFHDGEPFNAE